MKTKAIICKITLLFSMLFFYTFSLAQSPQGFSYQGVVRNNSGAIVGNQAIGVKVILENTSSVEYYSEIHSTNTNAQGVFNITVGNGTKTSNGLFKDIPWSNGDVRLKVGLDISGGTSYSFLENPTILQSVPYALYAESVKEVNSPSTATDTDPIFVVKNKTGQVVFAVYQSGVRMYVDDLAKKGAKGGFAVGGLTGKANSEYFLISPDSARIRLNPVVKGAKGGFAVGGLTSKGGTPDYFTVSPSNTTDIIPNSAQMLWYPLKEAFMVGRVEVIDPADVGLNSFASGYLSRAKGNYSTAIGNSCISSGQNSFAFGSSSLASNSYNVAIGNNAQAIGFSNNYAFGNNAIASGDNDNYAIGSNSKIVEGRNCYAMGSNAEIYPVLFNGAGSAGSYAIGNYALVRGQRAYAIGDHARALDNDAIAFGTNAKASAYTSIAIGANGSNADTTFASGQASIAIGYAANSDGSSSISIGTRSIATGMYSCALGDGAQATESNSAAFGNGAIANLANTIRIGNSGITAITGNVAPTAVSDKRLKKNIKEIGVGLDFILKLRPVEYQLLKGDERTNFGFIAQDIEQLVGTNNSILTIDGDKDRTLGLRYTDFIAPLVKAIQEQQQQIDKLKAKNKELESIKAELEEIKALLKK